MISAYVTIMTNAGTSQDIVDQLRALDPVDEAHIVAGEFDIVARVAADSQQDLLTIVTERIQSIEGVGRTSTCIVLD